MSKIGFDIVVIGGGIIGLSLADRLASSGMLVGVVDAAHAITPATNAAAGMLAPSFEGDPNGAADGDAGNARALYAFSALSLSMWSEFALQLNERTNINTDYRADGILGVAYDEARAQELRADYEALKRQGANVHWLDERDARALEPALAPGLVAAMLAKDDAQVDPRKVLQALHKVFLGAGGALYQSEAIAAARTKTGFQIELANGDALGTDRLVIASGAAAVTLLRELPPPPVFPVKGEALSLAMPEGLIRRVIRGPGAYLCPKHGGRLVIGASEHQRNADASVDQDEVEQLRLNGARVAPAITKLRQIESWSGLRPGTPDAAPILGCDGRGPDNIFLALGHYRNGILLAPASAKALAEEISGEIRGGQSLIDINHFRPERFDIGQNRRFNAGRQYG